MQIDVAYVVVGLIANNTGQLIARQNSTLQYITSNQLLCRRTMVGEVVGLRRSKYTTGQDIALQYKTVQNITLIQAITFAYQAERTTTNITVQQNKVKQK